MKTPWKKCDITVTVLLTMKTLLTLILIRTTLLQLVNKDYISSTQLSTRDNSREVNKFVFHVEENKSGVFLEFHFDL